MGLFDSLALGAGEALGKVLGWAVPAAGEAVGAAVGPIINAGRVIGGASPVGWSLGTAAAGLESGSLLADLYSEIVGTGATGYDDLINKRILGKTIGLPSYGQAAAATAGGALKGKAMPNAAYDLGTLGQFFPMLQTASTAAGIVESYRKRRHVNPTNFKALRRALSRITRFDKAVKKVIHIQKTGPKFKRKRRR